ncbi:MULTISPECIES: dihydrolipoyl dehydrogenase [Acidiplasma]|jgi:dihydrolipoamide dehydrogenase|uniref:Dihydrolipoyl dehydrogenase n=4 Tax=Acidiplasma TaxID=507753 RepID=A0A0Q0RSV6_9ARCH|nr:MULTISPECIES: dihydrolipoyl dehydrogenase [Acidiplasma]KJE48893.1 dihydrolipoamide dehydrogenase [Acidiplasma sp. MBA-1]KPV46631.1 dihydrolipoamide dehydrogenase [Acidiplasma aeolicum]KQB35475.1 dihydrolipoamide dehydrogenase [Acidiplasma cupricumulans]WMT54300.1 MAG: dihydrolipoyl dehydrogenase [Acidiplasma sp.]
MDYDVIILGAGAGGYLAALHLAKKKKKVLIIEKEKFGGECLNYGCIPSKALIELSENIFYLKNMPGMTLDYKLNMKDWQAWKDSMIKKITGGAEGACKASGATVLYGEGKIVNKNTVNVDGKNYTADYLILDTGSVPVKIKGIDDVYYNREILAIDHIPETLVVIGGGYIGIEMGTAFRKLGSDVYIVEMKDRILPEVDEYLSRAVDKRLRDLGIKILTSSRVLGVKKNKNYTVKIENSGDIIAETVLMAVGRMPNTQGYGLENLNLEMDGRFIKTDQHKRTSVDNVYAIGDVSGMPMLAHKAFYDAYVASENILGNDTVVDYKSMPMVVYTDPEIAFTGKTTDKYKQIPAMANPRTLTMNQQDGFFRVYYNDDGTISGAGIAAPRSSEIIAEIGLAVESGLTLDDMFMTVHPHPTVSEGIKDACEND